MHQRPLKYVELWESRAARPSGSTSTSAGRRCGRRVDPGASRAAGGAVVGPFRLGLHDCIRRDSNELFARLLLCQMKITTVRTPRIYAPSTTSSVRAITR